MAAAAQWVVQGVARYWLWLNLLSFTLQRNRCQLPKLEEAVLNESSFQVLDTMRGWVKDEAWSRWQDYLGVFQ